MKNKCMLVAALLLLSGTISAKVVLPPMFSDNMVLQQQADAPIWGEAKPMKAVKVTTSWDGKTYETLADKEGRWKLSVRTPEAGGPYELTLTDGQKLVLKNVMIGEVWICSGQSNMEMPLKGWGKVLDYEKEIAAANHPNIRLLHVEHVTSTQPETDIKIRDNGWQVCSPLTVPEFSATAYFFGREISEKQNVPVGLIHTSWGGTDIETWTSWETAVKTNDTYKKYAGKDQEKAMGYSMDNIRLYKEALKKDKGLVQKWYVPAYKTKGWKTMAVPKVWEAELANEDGIVWFRKTIDLPAGVTGKKPE